MVTVSDDPEWLSLRDDQGMSKTGNRGSLTSVLVRIERAKAHLADFERRAKPISAACQMTREHDDQKSEYIFRLSKVPAIPPVLSAIIGDAIHNLRVSLDYLAWQLVLAAGGTPGDNTRFPILEVPPTPDRYGQTLPNISPRLPKDMRKALDEVQPYKRPEPQHHDLAILHQLDINDKHHELLIAVLGSNAMAYWGDAMPTSSFNVGPYNDGAEICRFGYTDTSEDFAPTILFDVRLGESDAGYKGATFGAADLVRLPLRYIENEVLPRFRGFLGS
jgi:hypothetical protein